MTCAGIVNTSTPARALTINAIFDSSITGLSNAATVEAAFNTAAGAYTTAFTAPVTVNIKVGWGNVGGQPFPSNAAGASQTAVTGFWNYSQIRGYLAPSVSLPATQTGPSWFAMATAEGKALGLVAAKGTALDGSVGFNSSLTYNFNPGSPFNSGAFDFVGIAEHEIAEVLGRNSSVIGNPQFYQTPVDLFRYSAPGVQSYSYTGASYFSVDGGVTNLGWWNNAASGGDRADWLTGAGGSYPYDAQNAYVSPGATTLSPTDLALLGALGWNVKAGGPNGSAGTIGTVGGGAGIGGPNAGFSDPGDIDTVGFAVPEPAALMILATGLAGIALTRRTRLGA